MSALEQYSNIVEANDAHDPLRARLDELETDFLVTSDHLAQVKVEMTTIRMQLSRARLTIAKPCAPAQDG